jgi:hypothetical protein
MAKTGRPSKYNATIANKICEQLVSGKSLRAICAKSGMPNTITVYRWLAAHEEFRDQYARARADQAERYLDEIIEIADNEGRDTTTTADGAEVVNHAAVNRARLRVDARKWAMSKLAPKKYGDKVQAEHSGPDGGPIEFRTIYEAPKSDKS